MWPDYLYCGMSGLRRYNQTVYTTSANTSCDSSLQDDLRWLLSASLEARSRVYHVWSADPAPCYTIPGAAAGTYVAAYNFTIVYHGQYDIPYTLAADSQKPVRGRGRRRANECTLVL